MAFHTNQVRQYQTHLCVVQVWYHLFIHATKNLIPFNSGDIVSLPYICLGAAGSLQLVLHQIRVVGRGDEVMVEGLSHVLIHTLVGRV